VPIEEEEYVSTQYGHLKANNIKFLKIAGHNFIKSYSDLNLLYVCVSD